MMIIFFEMNKNNRKFMFFNHNIITLLLEIIFFSIFNK